MSLEAKRREYLRHMESPEFLEDEKGAAEKAEKLKKELDAMEFEGLSNVNKFRTSVDKQVAEDREKEDKAVPGVNQ